MRFEPDFDGRYFQISNGLDWFSVSPQSRM